MWVLEFHDTISITELIFWFLFFKAGVQRYSCSGLLSSYCVTKNPKKSTTRNARLFTRRHPFVIRNFRPCLICWFKSHSTEAKRDLTPFTIDFICEDLTIWSLFLSSKFKKKTRFVFRCLSWENSLWGSSIVNIRMNFSRLRRNEEENFFQNKKKGF